MTIGLRRSKIAGFAHTLARSSGNARGQSARCDRRGHRRGMTLVELLVVVGIILLVAAIAVPALQPASRRYPVREAARGLSAFLQAARIDAMESGRPVGVVFERFSGNPNACFVVHQVEIPPTYGGDTTTARLSPLAIFYVDPSSPNTPPRLVGVMAAMSGGMIEDGLIRPGDLLQLNYQGPWYSIAERNINLGSGIVANPDTNGDGFLDVAPGGIVFATYQGQPGYTRAPPWRTFTTLKPPWTWTSPPTFGPPVPFLIQRIPTLDATGLTDFGGNLLFSPVPPLRLTGGAVIDSAASGTASHPTGFESVSTDGNADLLPTILIFSPDGTVQRVYHRHLEYSPDLSQVVSIGFQVHPVIEPIYLLVGKWERMPASPRDVSLPLPRQNPPYAPSMADDGLYNFQDPENLWVVLNPQTGSITQAEVYVPPQHAAPISGGNQAAVITAVRDSRQLAREVQLSKGGR